MLDLFHTFGFGFPALADGAIFVARVAVGLMFFLSGFYKVFSAAQASNMRQTLVDAGIAAPRETAKFVSLCEFVFGALLVVGLLSSLAAAVLLIISLVALITVGSKSVKGMTFGLRLSSFLYLPETLLIVLLGWLIVAGPGLYSLDTALFVLP